MKACGLIVEYNPFHNGHKYHVDEAKKVSGADCMIAVMSGTFLQRGEPAIIDKFHRTRAALASGVDIVIELPFAYAVQSSYYFAKGAVSSLNELNVATICFGSESGQIKPFFNGVNRLQTMQAEFDQLVQKHLNKGLSYPTANSKAYNEIGLDSLDLMQPNNILGFSYVKAIVENHFPIDALTIKRKSSNYHDEYITDRIASATSIRKELKTHEISQKLLGTLPIHSKNQLESYKEKATLWHDWEQYFPLLYYRITTMTKEELANIHGVDEGIESRIFDAVKIARNFSDLIERVKTKRYTHVRLQRMFVHILTNTTKKQVEQFFSLGSVPYIRLLGMTKTGRTYLNSIKKELSVPLITNLNKRYNMIYLDERALQTYYSILPIDIRMKLRKQEFELPIII